MSYKQVDHLKENEKNEQIEINKRKNKQTTLKKNKHKQKT
jgi:hypothetical protein